MTGTLPTHATRGVRVSPEVLAEAFYASCRYLLRAILAGVDGSKGDIIDAVLLTAIMDADIGHLDEIDIAIWGTSAVEHLLCATAIAAPVGAKNNGLAHAIHHTAASLTIGCDTVSPNHAAALASP